MFDQYKNNLVLSTVIVVIIIFLLCCVIIAIGYLLQRNHLRNLRKIEELISSHKETLMESEVEIQKETFKKVSDEMSSTIGKTLRHVEAQLLDSKNADSVKSTNMIKDATATLSDAMEELRDISRSMSSELIKHYGLLKALEFELEPLIRYNIHQTQIKVNGQFIFLRAYEELIIFRIIQEGIKNIVKHSKSSSLLISLSYQPDNLTIEISDRGIGFKKHTVPIRGKGLSDIERRTQLLNGTMRLINDSGAILKVDIPITEANSRPPENPTKS